MISQFAINKPSSERKNEMSDAAVLCAAIDMRPFSFINGDGFKLFAKQLITIGAEYGRNTNIEDVLPSRYTISRHLSAIYDTLKERVINDIISSEYFGSTCDHWIHDTYKTNYLTYTVQFIKDGRMISRVLGTRITINKTAETTLKIIKDMEKEFKVNDKHITYVTDNAAAMKLAFSNYDWIGCASHNLNLVQKHAFHIIGIVPELISINKLIDSAKELVTYVKQSAIQMQLKEYHKTLKQMIEIRWDSRVEMLESIKDNYECLILMAENKDKIMDLIMHIEESLLTQLINTLKPLRDSRIELCSETSPTVHLVLPTKVKLLEHLNGDLNDHPSIIYLKERLRNSIKWDFPITDIHKCATLLTPIVKSLQRLLNDSEIRKIHKYLIKEMDKLQVSMVDTNTQSSESLSESCLGMFADNIHTIRPETSESELNRYLNSNEIIDPIKFWTQNTVNYP